MDRLTVFYDGACPICSREMAVLRRRDRHGALDCVDIAAADFEPAAWGPTHAQFMAKMHARLPDGTWVTGVDAFRAIWSRLGYGWLATLTRTPGLRGLLDLAYRAFAANRTRLTGRCNHVDGTCDTSCEPLSPPAGRAAPDRSPRP